MSEQATNTRVMQALKGFHPIRVENPACAGTPDINFTLGWIENKHLATWPRSGIVRVPHFSPQQRAWHIQRYHSGGRSWVFLQVGREYLLFNGHTAALYLGRVEECSLRRHAAGIWDKGLNDAEFLNTIRSC